MQDYIKPNASSLGILDLSSVKVQNVTDSTDLKILVKDQLPMLDQLLEILTKWQFPISFVSGILIGQIFPWIRNKFKRKYDVNY